jgi:hypothetical protein
VGEDFWLGGASGLPGRHAECGVLGLFHLLVGEQAAAERLIAEDRLIAEATGNPPVAYAAMMLAAWQGQPGPSPSPGPRQPGLATCTVRLVDASTALPPRR